MRFYLTLSILISSMAPLTATAACWELPVDIVTTPGVAVISPGGTAPSLASQGLTIFIQVFDCEGLPLPNFPAVDIWVSDLGTGELSICQNGSIADADTDAEGRTTIAGAISGGGYTTTGVQVYLSGNAVGPPGPLPVDFISPDYDGDLVVDIVDFIAFAADFGTGATRSDFTSDGTVGLSDFAAFGIYFGDTCP